ncbi:MAG: hypothetical protein V1910_02315 [bacterium]
MIKKILTSVTFSMFPLLVLAGDYTTSSGIEGLLKWFSGILSIAIPVIFSLAVVFFIWQVFTYAIASKEEDKIKAKNQMIWGIVGIAVMVSIWGLVAILTSTFNTEVGPTKVDNLIPKL